MFHLAYPIKEKEGEIVIYDIEFKQEGQKFKADGTIYNWGKRIPDKDLPDTVKNVIDKKNPDSTIQEIMDITAVNNGKDTLEGYEIVLETADSKDIEATVAPDSIILEDSGETK